MKTYLLISLGHNSSAVYVSKHDTIGYEQERIDRIKSSSAFPKGAIEEIKKHVTFNNNICIRISHWFDFANTYENKYITKDDLDYLRSISDDIKFVDKNFTHHDAHAYSAYMFYDEHVGNRRTSNTEVYSIVADGFGNNEEVISVYLSTSAEKLKLIHRVYGYRFSLGLMYQYATSFCGMKENQDEYKFLGYESHIDEHFDSDVIKKIDDYMSYVYLYTFSDIFDSMSTIEVNSHNSTVDVNSLSKRKQIWYAIFNDVINFTARRPLDDEQKRILIGYFVQKVIEKVVASIIDAFSMDNVILSGGIFYNVKLNNSVLQKVKGYVCIMPLAGDQGAPFGFLLHENFDFKYGDLCYGIRSKISSAVADTQNLRYVVSLEKNASVREDQIDKISWFIYNQLKHDKIVNIVQGNMEFGPRALCNTSSLMIATKENVAANNRNNKRNEVMPNAPIVLPEYANELFSQHELNRTIGSDSFMICTHDYKDGLNKNIYGGVMHKKPLLPVFTGRPQIIQNNPIIRRVLTLLAEMDNIFAIVNTSFNVHGQPIVFDLDDVEYNHNFQVEVAGNSSVVLIIINEAV